MTDRFQDSVAGEQDLPRVPIPSLEASCSRFLEWSAPLLTRDELAQTEAAVLELLSPDSPAHDLQAALVEYDATEGVQSWLDEFWADRYLGRRDRIALNANFFFLLRDNGEDQVTRAAGLIAGAVSYKRAIDDGQVPRAMVRGRPLSMVQNSQLFSSTRIPHATRDQVRAPHTPSWPGPSTERHIIVFAHGHMFAMDVIRPDGRPHTLPELRAALDSILATSTVAAPQDTRVGHLTTKARAEWAASRSALLEVDPANEAAIDNIERALFCFSLEGSVADHLDACDQLLHGDSGNRWFDKAVTMIVFADGTAGLNTEHCNLDGTTVVAFIDALFEARLDEAGARGDAAIRAHHVSWSSRSSSTIGCDTTS